MSKNILSISKLTGNIEDKTVCDDISLNVNEGEIVAIMGPNGSGKSSLAQIIMGNPEYEVSGSISLFGEEISDLKTNERSVKGIYLAFQYPYEVPGLNFSQFLRAAYNARLPKEEKMNVFEFRNLLRENLKKLHMTEDFLERNLNEGFSGGEKKKAEILQMMVLKPKLIILDETDSGLDVDALKTVFENLKKYKEENPNSTILVISHYSRVFEYLKPNRVVVIQKGKVQKEGGVELLSQIDKDGYINI